ncbi:MAG: DUF4363 family protein, partial [Clostridia bacterium]|nr:DUF4363 family protein [Clostridia bacterium]
LLLLVGGSFLEQWQIRKNFTELEQSLLNLYQRIEAEEAVASEAELIYKSWEESKRKMHTYLPHSEIRDISFWLAEVKSYVSSGNFEDAQAKTATLIVAVRDIPKRFFPSFSNIF